MSTSFSRRTFLTGAGLGAVAVGGGAAAVAAFNSSDAEAQELEAPVEFYGPHQAGIATPQQENLHIVALDVLKDAKAEDLKKLLTQWTGMAAHMCAGEPASDKNNGIHDDISEYAVPSDSGEAADLAANQLTITIGYGPSLFDNRFGLKKKKPAQLEPLPKFPSDQLVEELCYGDIVIQACANDPQVAVHAVRNLTRAGSGVVEVRWSQLGYGRASSTSEEQSTPRNLFGFKDGTRNIKGEETADMDSYVWSDEPTWMDGGSFMCVRRVRMLLEVWDRQTLKDQQETFGRYRKSGAPMGTADDPAKEHDTVPLDLVMGTEPAVPETSHVYLAHPDNNDGQRILRRAYNFVEGSDSFGHISAGLFFIAYAARPAESFIPIQMKLSRNDKMNEYVRYESSAIFACPRGLADGEDWGTQLFD
ncbi:deferrochelatase/peroxidase EfeB [Corynebacterium sp. zg254]|uniref:Deferrochelatase n=1 Tax=Corynebacterium zhongnanshanii TaxID=2768834 RepID=A0ABQ6VFR7_9CORY|nr:MULTISPECIES: iron uptake transporter deferrochelatase/peroxidase subunit [Corynebacterium]KAB3523259.1 deferrochelatase/peroxidase EfeB [Corynebacterium zhongnanshanii]MCR5913623.1 deferrochelatase/peroxidase EfeB [Corynebacterium sp. zg254]